MGVGVNRIGKEPTITSDGGGGTASLGMAENTTAVTTVVASDPENDAVTFAIAGGADAGLFAIDADLGTLTFVAAPDFEAPGDGGGDNSYEVVVEADDGNGGLDSQTLTVAVTDVDDAPVIPGDDGGGTDQTFETRISVGRDDVEQIASGRVRRGDTDLDLGDETDIVAVGLRFAAIDIPQGVTITAAYLQFRVDETDSGAATLTIHGHDTDNAGTFRFFGGDVTGRAATSATVAWAPSAWTSVGAAEQTSDLSSIIQEIVDRPGWLPDNAMAFIITGDGGRVAESFNGDAGGAPLLHVEYSLDGGGEPPANRPPVATDDSGATVEGTPVTIAVLANDSDPDGGDTVTLSGAVHGANGTVAVNPNGTVTYTPNNGFTGGDVFTYTVSDGHGGSDSGAVSVTVSPAGGGDGGGGGSGGGSGTVETFEARITVGRDDVEQIASGRVRRGDTDLDLDDETDIVAVGLRFAAIDIPQGATITAAYLQFQADETSSGGAALTIHGHDTDNAGTFRFFGGDVTARTATSAAVAWAPSAWTSVGGAEQTSDLSSIIQEIVDRPGWLPDNAMAFIITGDGGRVAESFNGDPGAAPLLHVEFSVDGGGGEPPANRPPVARNDSGATVEDTPVTIAVLANDSDPDGGDTLTLSGAVHGANGAVAVNPNGTVTYTPNSGFTGGDVFTYTVSDGQGGSDSATVSVTVTEAGGDGGGGGGTAQTFETRISVGRDDVEQIGSGRVRRGDSDLDLGGETDIVAVGLRFAAIDIPQGATITAAYLQFQVDETSAGASTLVIHGHDTDNAGTFRFFGGDVTGRNATTATVAWTPPDWTSVGDAGPAQQTSDLSTIIQEIINRPGWLPDNAMAFVITGDGGRIAESFNGDAAAAPLLHVEYSLGGGGEGLFVFRDGDGADTITDFTAGAGSEDVLNLYGVSGLGGFAAVQAAASQVGDDTLLDFGGGDTVTLIGVDVASLHEDDFLI